jgi:formylglycine-generating enzyme
LQNLLTFIAQMRITLNRLLFALLLCALAGTVTAKSKSARAITEFNVKPVNKFSGKDSNDSSNSSAQQSLRMPSLQKNTAIIPTVVDIPQGCFKMGSPATEAGRNVDENPHQVCVKGFKLAINEVTVAEFSKFIEATDYSTDAEKNSLEKGCWSYEKNPGKFWDWREKANWKQPIQGTYPLKYYPVSCVSFNDVMAYIKWLNNETGHQYRLPTEAEWEYAARAGTTTARYWGNDPEHACSYANVADHSKSGSFQWPEAHHCLDGHFFAAMVKSYRANNFQLHDMLGNVWEWVCSPYDEFYTGGEEICTDQKPDNYLAISIRGGGWNADASRARAAHRDWGLAWSRQANLGFRLVRVR